MLAFLFNTALSPANVPGRQGTRCLRPQHTRVIRQFSLEETKSLQAMLGEPRARSARFHNTFPFFINLSRSSPTEFARFTAIHVEDGLRGIQITSYTISRHQRFGYLALWKEAAASSLPTSTFGFGASWDRTWDFPRQIFVPVNSPIPAFPSDSVNIQKTLFLCRGFE